MSYLFFSILLALAPTANAIEWSKIPVRFDAALIAIPATIDFEGYKSIGYNGYGLGADFELLMPGIHSLLGISGLISTDLENRNHIDSLSMASAYWGFTFKSVDLLFGPALGLAYRRLEEEEAAPNVKAEYKAKLAGGMIGLRRNLFADGFIGISLALKGFYLSASEYDRDLDDGSTKSSTVEDKGAAAYGGWVELTFAIGGKSKHEGWGWGFAGLR